MIIYTVELHDYDNDEVIGYFTEEEAAQTCCDYFNLVSPSNYEKFNWEVKHFRKNNMDYATLLDGELRRRAEEKQKMIDAAEAKELELYKQLREKYGDIE